MSLYKSAYVEKIVQVLEMEKVEGINPRLRKDIVSGLPLLFEGDIESFKEHIGPRRMQLLEDRLGLDTVGLIQFELYKFSRNRFDLAIMVDKVLNNETPIIASRKINDVVLKVEIIKDKEE